MALCNSPADRESQPQTVPSACNARRGGCRSHKRLQHVRRNRQSGITDYQLVKVTVIFHGDTQGLLIGMDGLRGFIQSSCAISKQVDDQ